jgi:hypothetical protein
MNGKQRLAKAMCHELPDRVPVMCQLALGHYFLNTDLPPHKIWFTSEGFAEALVTLQRRYRFDGILINLPGRPENLLDEVRIEQGPRGEVLTWANGDTTFFPWDDNPQHTVADRSKPLRADFAAIDPDDLDFLDELTGYVWGTYHIPLLAQKPDPGPLSRIPPYFYRTIDLVLERVGDEVSVHGEVFSPLTHFMELFGYENALVHLITDAPKSHALLDRLTEASIAWGVGQARRGVDAVLVSSAFAGGPYLSTAMYKEFVVPYEGRLNEAIKAAGVHVYTHTCGSIGDRLEWMVETGTQGLDALDPPPLGNAELADAKEQVGDRLFIKGNLNAVELLAAETKAEVIAYASERIRVGKPGGGYILSTSCSVSPRMEPWKLELLTPLAEEIGGYPG